MWSWFDWYSYLWMDRWKVCVVSGVFYWRKWIWIVGVVDFLCVVTCSDVGGILELLWICEEDESCVEEMCCVEWGHVFE